MVRLAVALPCPRSRPRKQVTIDYSTSFIRLPFASTAPDYDINANWGAGPDAKTKQGVCLTLELEPLFLSTKKEFDANPQL